MKPCPTVQSLWSIQEESLRGQGAKQNQVTEMRKAYFVAFYDALMLLRDDLGNADLPEAEAVACLETLVAECEAFLETTAQRRGTAGRSPEEIQMDELKVDPSRVGFDNLTGVYIRARMPDGAWVSVDIAALTDESLAAFVRSRGPVSDLAVGTVQALLVRLKDATARAGEWQEF